MDEEGRILLPDDDAGSDFGSDFSLSDSEEEGEGEGGLDLRMRALFERWDSDQSGSLEVEEVNRVVALYNEAYTSEEWAELDEEHRMAHGEALGFYGDDGEPDKKMDFEDMKEFLMEEAMECAPAAAAPPRQLLRCAQD